MGKSKNRKMEFKRFTVHDDKCAMKIGTDAILLGALANHPNPKYIIDVGTGSGIVALMLAQRFPEAIIDAIELNKEAAEQASENFAKSPFTKRLRCHNMSFQDWSDENQDKFQADLIVSNPPFFDSTSKSPDEARNMARHQDFLPPAELLQRSMRMVNKLTGKVVFVWPIHREEEVKTIADRLGMFYNGACRIKATENHEAVRMVTRYSHQNVDSVKLEDETLILENGVGNSREFTPKYLELVKDFFLKA